MSIAAKLVVMSSSNELHDDVEVFEPTGSIEQGEHGPELVIVRDFPQTPAVVWEYITDSEVLARWYGSWTPAQDSEGRPALNLTTWDSQETVKVAIAKAKKPDYVELDCSNESGDTWTIFIELTEIEDGCVLEFRQTLDGIEDQAELHGPKWEFKIDRLMIALAGGDVNNVALENYYPAQAEHYAL